jgi:hypothetical protein
VNAQSKGLLHSSQNLTEFYNKIKEIAAGNTKPTILEVLQVKVAPTGQGPEEQQILRDEPKFIMDPSPLKRVYRPGREYLLRLG